MTHDDAQIAETNDDNAITVYPHWGVYGHDWALEFLYKSLVHGRTRHAYLITGAEGVGKMRLAQAFAQALNCTHDDQAMRPCGVCRSCKLMQSGNHPDVIYSEQDSKSGIIKIDTLRDMMRLLALKPFDSRYRIGIFDHFDMARPQAQDALLKTLEEPSPHAVLLLLAKSDRSVLATITSRCQRVPLRPTSLALTTQVLQVMGAEEEHAEKIGRFASGRIGWALHALRDENVLLERGEILNMLEQALEGNRAKRFAIAEDLSKQNKDVVRYALEIWQTYWRDLLLLAEHSPVKPCNADRHVFMQRFLITNKPEEVLKALQSTQHCLRVTLNTNANVRMMLETLMLDYPGLEYRD
jgi:DNA polymerase-3 subunit delta'